MNRYISGFISAISFFTIIPAGGNHEITEYTMDYFTAIGTVLGIISGLAYYLAAPYSHLIASASALSILIVLYGFNHFDSVLDFGDSLMVRGYEKKQQVIKDKYTGSGGVGMFFILYLLSFSFLAFFNPVEGLLIIVSGEIVSKYITLLSMKNAHSFNNGIGSLFMEKANKSKNAVYLNAVFFIIPVLFNIYNIVIIIIVLILMLLIRNWISRVYHGINGDIIGSIGEISRLMFYILSFIFIIIGLNFISFLAL
ncbi:MAG: adenosylcobinamide-GDP ribazoletransferase [Ferroplasma sp.]